jgi:hypothetical protein
MKNKMLDFLRWTAVVAVGLPFVTLALFILAVIAKFLWIIVKLGWTLI